VYWPFRLNALFCPYPCDSVSMYVLSSQRSSLGTESNLSHGFSDIAAALSACCTEAVFFASYDTNQARVAWFDAILLLTFDLVLVSVGEI